MRDIKLIVLLMLLCFAVRSQSDSALVRNASGKTLKRLGKSALKQNDPTSAITFFEAYLKNARDDAAAMALLAQAYLEIRDYERAQRMYLNAYRTNKQKAPEALYYHAQMQKSNGQYDSAKINFQKFKKEYKGSQKALKKQAGKEVSFCDSIQNIVKHENKIVIQHLGADINKINAEGAPVNLDDHTLLFTALRTDKIEYVIEDDTAKTPKKKIYTARRKNNKWEFSGEWPEFNDDDVNTANVCFSPDRKRLYFTRCKLNDREKMICAIYVSEKTKDGWAEPVKLPDPVNLRKYTSTMPAVTSDPAKGNDVIYFVSNRKKGKGGTDIWYTVYDKKNKKYKEPKNAGSKINTAQNEISPFFDNETRTLYFSSDGLGGLGGFDIYKATGDGKKWTGSENIGQPLNTGADDIFYTISTNRAEGFFVSNRKGGNALKNSTCCDDIYYYKQTDYIQINLKGTVGDMLDENVSISNATIEIYLKDKKNQEKFLVKTTTSDSLGNYKTKLEAGKEYQLVIKKKDFLGQTEEISTMGMTSSQDIEHSLRVVKKPKQPKTIPNVEYEFGKADITESGKKAINSAILGMLQANPELIIEIQAHTDSKGSESYNMKLSQKRAENIVKYLVEQGIGAEHLQAKGYGESQPVAPNENADGSDNPDGRARNRRTDFKIVGLIEEEQINDSGLD